MPDLILERREQENETVTLSEPSGRTAMSLTPFVSESYWAYRVKLSDRQAIVGFPKFSTVGIGFAVEEDWNTNLPYTCGVDEIWKHVAHNKGDDTIVDADCVEAIRMVRAAIAEDRIEHELADRVQAHQGRRDAQAEVYRLRKALVNAHVWLPFPSPIWDETSLALGETRPEVAVRADR